MGIRIFQTSKGGENFWLELSGGLRCQNSSVLKLSPAQFYFFFSIDRDSMATAHA